MGEFLFLLGGVILGGLIIWLFLNKIIIDKESKIRASDGIITELRTQIQQKDAELERVRSALDNEQQIRISTETRLEETKRNLEEQRQLLSVAEQKLTDVFKALSSDVLKSNTQIFLDLAQKTFENLLTDAKGDLGKRQQAIEEIIKPLKDYLNKFEFQIRELEKSRSEAYGQLSNQLKQLQKETTNLVTALKRPTVRGRWGEITLRRVVEVAGMSQYCDFIEKPSLDTEEGRKQPDLIVKLPGGRTIVVDAKAPLDAYLTAVEAENEEMRSHYLIEHAKAVREHMRILSSKAYWNQFSESPDFVILFLPGESFFSAALEQDRNLIEDGIVSKVILATPTTLIALLRTVALAWQQHRITENAQMIAEMGTELFDRISKFAEHLSKIREGLDKTIEAYNSAIGSWENRLVPSVRKLKELGAGTTQQEFLDIEPIDKSLRKEQGLSDSG